MEFNTPLKNGMAESKVLPDNDNADIDLLTRLKNGDESAFKQIYLKWHKPIYLLMFKIMRSEPDAEDVAQDVFAHLWSMREKIEPSKNIKALLFIIARRSAINLSRRAGLHLDYLSEVDVSPKLDINPAELLEARETALLMQIAIEKMSARQRQVFSLYYNENLTSSEIASRLGLTQENVRKHIYNGKKDIQRIIAMITLLFLINK